MSLKKFLTVAFLSVTIAVAHAQKPTDKRLAGLDTFAARVLKDWHAPGVAIAVVEKNRVVYTGGFGYRDNEKQLPVTENTLFAIGSCTKAFTASMIGMLQQEGKLSLDKPVRNYLPELKFKDPVTNDQITLRDMMCHRSGLPRHDYSWYGATASRMELLERVQYQEPSFGFRERYQYNNFMFMAQGVVIEKLTGKSWEQNLQERIFNPLGMTHSNMSVPALEKVDDKSWAYQVGENNEIKKIPYRNIDAIGPAGSINSCAADMANWLITWINSGKFKGKEIFPANYRDQAISAQVAMGGGTPGPENPDLFFGAYGLAWSMSSYRGHYRVEHGGGIDGFITTTSFFPSDSIGIFVVSNQGGVSNSIRNYIVDKMLGLSYRNWNQQLLANNIKAKFEAAASPNTDSVNRKPGTKPSHGIEEYTGRFENKGYGILKTFTERDTLWIDYNEGGRPTKSWLEHYHYDVFRLRQSDEPKSPKYAAKFSFSTDEDGDIVSIQSHLEPAVDNDIVFTKLPPDIKVDNALLQKYTGDYLLNGATVRVYIKDGSTLMVNVPGQPDYELVPAGQDLFNLKIAKGYSVKFEMDEKQSPLSLTFQQPNGNFKATRKK